MPRRFGFKDHKKQIFAVQFKGRDSDKHIHKYSYFKYNNFLASNSESFFINLKLKPSQQIIKIEKKKFDDHGIDCNDPFYAELLENVRYPMLTDNKLVFVDSVRKKIIILKDKFYVMEIEEFLKNYKMVSENVIETSRILETFMKIDSANDSNISELLSIDQNQNQSITNQQKFNVNYQELENDLDFSDLSEFLNVGVEFNSDFKNVFDNMEEKDMESRYYIRVSATYYDNVNDPSNLHVVIVGQWILILNNNNTINFSQLLDYIPNMEKNQIITSN